MDTATQQRKPILTRVNDFDEWGSRMLSWSIQDTKQNNQNTLALVIDSYGGEVYSLMGMIDLILNSGLEIITIASAKAMSCGAFLLSFGKKRYATENSTIMIHGISGSISGDAEKAKNKAKEMERLTNKAFEMLDKNTNQQPGFWLNKLAENNNNDLYLSAEQAKEWGLITDIGIPKVNEFFENKIENEDTDESFDNLKVLLSYQKETNTYIHKNEQKQGGTMDLQKVLGKLSEDEKKPITALQNELISAKQDVEIKSKELETKMNEIKALNDNHAKVLADLTKKSDNDFIDSLIAEKKLSLAEKNDELEILANLPESVKAKHKAKLLAKSAVVQGEVPNNGENGFDGGELSYKAKLEKVAKKYNLDLKKQSDLAEAQILEAKGGY